MGELKIGDLYQSAYLVASGYEFPRVVFEHGVATLSFPDDDGTVTWYVEAYKVGSRQRWRRVGDAGQEVYRGNSQTERGDGRR